MTKKEYLEELEDFLEGYPQDVRNDVLEAFEDHFAMGEAEGVSDQELLENLGSLDEVKSNIIEQYGKGNDKSNDNFISGMFAKLSRHMNFNDFSNDFRDKSYNKSETYYDVFDGQGDSEARRCQIQCDHKVSVDIEITGGDKFDYKLTWKEDKLSHYVKPEIFKSVNDEVIMLHVYCDSDNVFERSVAKLKVTLPLSVTSLFINSLSGNVSVEKINLDDADITLTSGDVDFTSVNCNQLTVNSVSGDVTLESFTGDMNAHTTSGDFDIQKHQGKIDIHTTSGDIKISEHYQGDVVLESTSGDVKAVLNDEPYAIINTISGDIDCVLNNSNVSGEISTLSGDVMIDNVDNIARHGKGKYYFGNGNSPVRLKTVSGDIKVS